LRLLEQRQQITDRADFLVAQENISIFEQGALLSGLLMKYGDR